MSEHARKRARAVLRGRDDGDIIPLPDRSFIGWYRHITLVLLAYAFLVGIRVHDTSHLPATAAPEQTAQVPPLLPITTSEVRHLLARLFFSPPCQMTLVQAWSGWRRQHQYWASYYHCQHRLKAG